MGDGMAALEMLNIMEQFKPDAAGPHSASELHTRIEAMKLAYADVKAYDADPRFAKIPVEGLLSKEYAARAGEADRSRKGELRRRSGRSGNSDTTYFTVVDREGNILSHHSERLLSVRVRRLRWREWGSCCRIAARFSRSIRQIPNVLARAQAAVPHHYSGIHAARR